RLVSTESQRGQYLTLSYVWGGDQVHKTTTGNVSAYERSIDISLLPATIRDAIHVTHALGFSSLWVDSLCIIQDSDEDKRREIGRMHHIYRYAHLTIIAASANKVTESFLNDRPPPPCFKYLMAPRALIFTARTLQYRCLTATHHVGDSLCDTYDKRRLPDTLFMRDPPPAQPGSEEWASVYTAWLGVVWDYSHRAASVAADKLVACAAIAEHFHRCLDSDYLAGLWRATLLADLLWSRRWDEYGHYPAAYRAPSWSWAALEGEVFWSGQWSQAFWADNALAKVVRCAVTLEDDGLPFGRVTGGSLVLSG
ncbi:HET-domain-containing protein, partial [Trametes versicolor FP-101664 SS1]|uniref:HET-domain-containing protein n=1 Tax=Trametes versicolor (strain FP-101664) TaxID=717944 RepID=UPI0004622A57